MSYSYEINLGLSYLRSKRKRSGISVLTWLSVLGVTIGVMAVNVVLSVMNGFDEDLKSKIVGIKPHIIASGYLNHPISNYDELSQSISKLDHVKAVGPYVEGQALLRSRERSLGVMVWGIDPDHPQAITDLDRYLWEARASDLKAPTVEGSGRSERIFLGSVLARLLHVSVGDDVILFLPVLQQTPLGMTPRSMKFQVAGVFSTGFYDYDSAYTYVSLPVAQKMYDLQGFATGVAVKVDEVDRAPAVAKQIRDNTKSKFYVQDWLQVNHSLFVAIQTEKLVMGIILSLIVLVAALGIVNTLSILVIEKTKDIGILKAMGASDSSVKLLFVFQGLAIGSLGILLGLFLGFVLCQIISVYPIPMPGGGAVYEIDRLPVKVEPLICYLVVPVVSILLCLMATLYPSRQAAKLEPVEAIRIG